MKNKIALITGATSGIGKASAITLAKMGFDIIATGRRKERLDELEKELPSGVRYFPLVFDVRDREKVGEILGNLPADWAAVDVLINNAGALVQRVPIEAITDALFDEVVHLNVRSAMVCSAAAVEAMRRQGSGGAIINVTSVAARHGGGAGASLYAGSKGFISTMTRGLAKELVKDRIRVNAVAPGVITTPFHDRFSTPAMLEAFKATIPMNRLGAPEECAGAFIYLASEQMSSYITGQILEVNGGQYMP